jgi:hypothetical protein
MSATVRINVCDSRPECKTTLEQTMDHAAGDIICQQLRLLLYWLQSLAKIVA